MTQRMVIVLLPLELLLLSILIGCLVVAGMQLDLTAAAVAALPAPAAAVATSVAKSSSAPIEVSAAPAPELSPVFTPEVQHWASKITAWAAEYQLDPALVATVMQIESCGNPAASSPSGAEGLFQVMPYHFAAGDDMLDPDTNAARGLAYLSLGLQRAGGNTGLALAGYNGGHNLIGLAGSLWPAQTQRYWYWGTGIYKDALSGQSSSPRLQEWLAAGGASLCARAAHQLAAASN
jgi:soluble lytic murein transglycosylase-like protein